MLCHDDVIHVTEAVLNLGKGAEVRLSESIWIERAKEVRSVTEFFERDSELVALLR
jgi:hypothetical protein